MKTYDARRQTILDLVAKNDGRASAKQMHDAIIAAGLDSNRANMGRYVRPLVKDGLLVLVGKGFYRDAKQRAFSTERFMDRLPYPTRTEGRILHYMLTHRLVRATELIANLQAAGLMTNRQLVYTALWLLQKEGYIRRVSQGTYTLTRKTLDLVGLSEVCDGPTYEFEGPLGRLLWPHVLELLGALGETSRVVLLDYLKSCGFPVERYHVDAAIRQLMKHGKVEKRSRARFALAPAKPPATTIAS